MLAAHATAVLALAEREEGLANALESRTTIALAQGILMEKFEIGAEVSFNFLKRISQHENTRLYTVAEASSRSASRTPDRRRVDPRPADQSSGGPAGSEGRSRRAMSRRAISLSLTL